MDDKERLKTLVRMLMVEVAKSQLLADTYLPPSKRTKFSEIIKCLADTEVEINRLLYPENMTDDNGVRIA